MHLVRTEKTKMETQRNERMDVVRQITLSAMLCVYGICMGSVY